VRVLKVAPLIPSTPLLKSILANMDFNKGVDGISGATLSTRTALNSIRKVMMIYQLMIKNKDSE